MNEEQEEEARLHRLDVEANGQLTNAKANYNRMADDARLQRNRIDTIHSRIGDPCGECGKPYCEADLADATTIATNKLRDLVAKAREIKEDVDSFTGSTLLSSRNLTEYRSTRTDIRATVEERRRLAQLLADRKTAEASMAAHTATAHRVKDQHDKLKAEINPFVDMLATNETELTSAIAKFRASEVLGVTCEKRVQVCKEVVKVFGPSGVRAHILDNVTPYLNDQTANYLGTLSDGGITAVWSTLSLNAKGELVEKFSIDVNKEGDADSFAGLSGGEKRKVRLACALALQDMVASRATKPVRLMIYDEVDDALDDAGLERLMGVFEEKARLSGTVLIISHNALGDFIREVVTVTRKDKESTISGCIVL